MSTIPSNHVQSAGSIRQLLLQRHRAASQPSARTDGAVLALVVEGGGMRGVVVSGMVSAMERLGMLDAFDILCGTSAGAFACAYFGAKQAELGTRIYTEDLCTSRFIARRRSLLRAPVMNLDYLVDNVLVKVKPLNTDVLLNRSYKLIFTTTDIATGKPHYISKFGDAEFIRNSLRASSRVPFIAGPPVVVDGRLLVDGAVSSPLPLSAAIDAGATHILVLSNQYLISSELGSLSLVERTIASLLRRTYGVALAKGYLESIPEYAYSRSVLTKGGTWNKRGVFVPVDVITPAKKLSIGLLCRDRQILSKGAQSGFHSVMNNFVFEPEP